MHIIDWILILVPLLVIGGVGIYAKRYTKSVVNFLSSGRLASRYLLATARGEMQAGAVVFVAAFEVISKCGFTFTWWTWINIPVGILISLTGFVLYRYRETRAITLAQFFEIRYSRHFRVAAGILGFIAGLLNFGIIPAVGSRFIAVFLGLPHEITIWSVSIPSYIPIMGLLLSITLFIALSGGLITNMVVNCLEGILSQVLYLVIIVGLLAMFHWSDITQVLGNRPPGESMFNPFDSLNLKDFNLWYVLMGMLLNIYGTMAWQNAGAYSSASLTPHEARMGSILSGWREQGKAAVVTLLAICAITYLQHPSFSAQSTHVQQQIASISQPQIQQQMQIPMAVSDMLAPGLKGALCIILLMGVFGGDSTHLISWGGLFIQDVWLPLTKKQLTPEQHIRLLRLSIIGVATFAFAFGCLVYKTDYIYMWWSITQSVFIGGAGAVIIGGLYWKKGTTMGAWSALSTGSILSFAGIIVRMIYPNFILNGIQIALVAAVLAIGVYVAISLLTNTEDFDMDRMLHRGAYADNLVKPEAKHEKSTWNLGRLIGFDENFTLGDKWIAGSLFAWSMMWFFLFVIGTIWNILSPWPNSTWVEFWKVIGIGIPIILSVVTAVWFTWGGLRDVRALFFRLSHTKSNVLDNGMVLDHQNLADLSHAPSKESKIGNQPVTPA